MQPEPSNPDANPEETVLIVDDEPPIRRLLTMLLQDAGFMVVTAAHGREALTLIDGRKVDLMLIDLVMPVMGGEEFLAEARRLGCVAPALIVSGSPEARDVAVATGCEGFLEKPYEFNDLILQIRSTLSRDADRWVA
jgi:CheY-like chemotaxis protein